MWSSSGMTKILLYSQPDSVPQNLGSRPVRVPGTKLPCHSRVEYIHAWCISHTSQCLDAECRDVSVNGCTKLLPGGQGTHEQVRSEVSSEWNTRAPRSSHGPHTDHVALKHASIGSNARGRHCAAIFLHTFGRFARLWNTVSGAGAKLS